MKKDLTKQPGIIAQNIILVDSSFKRALNFVEPLDFSCDFKYGFSMTQDKQTGQGKLQAKVVVNDNEKKEVFEIECSFVGIYVSTPEPNMELEDFLANSAPAHLVAFIREHVANMSIKAGLPALVLPPYNIMAMLSN